MYEVETLVGELRRALKVLSSEWATNDQMRERFINESQLLERVNHPNVGRCYAAGLLEDDGSIYLLLELVRGRALSRILAEEGKPLDPVRAVPMARQIASGLVAAHAKGVLHRDLKPDNILVHEDTADLSVKVVDFGIAKHMRRGRAITLSVVGTPEYMAPEQFSLGETLDARVDVWQLGATLFTMLTGQPPYAFDESDDAASVVEQHAAYALAGPRPSRVVPALAQNESLDELVSRMLASDREHRPRSAAAVCEVLARIEHGLSPRRVQTSSLALLDSLCAHPSDGAWWALSCFLQNRTEDQEMLIGGAHLRLSEWPSSLRRAPLGWWSRVKYGESYPLWPLVRALDLSGRPLSEEDIDIFSKSEACVGIEHLNLARCGLDDAAVSAIARSASLGGLRSLDLSGNTIGPDGADALASSTHLQQLHSLDLSGNALGSRGIAALARTQIPLRTLALADTSARKDGAFALADSEGLRHLERLDLAGNSIGADGAAAISTSRCLTALEQLDLSRNGLGSGGAAALSLAPIIRSLRRLRLAHNGLGQRGLELFVASGRCEALEEFDLSSNDIDASGAILLASSPFARRLRRLELADNRLDDAGLAVLLGSPHLSGLHHLGVAQNVLTDSSLRLMSAAPPRLASLDVSRNTIGRDGAFGLASVLPRMQVTRLLVNRCGIDAEAILSLLEGGAGRLQQLDLSGNGLGPEGIELVAQAPQLAGIHMLDVSQNALRAHGMKCLGASTFLTELHELHLNANEMGDEGCEELARSVSNMPVLETLSLSDNLIGPRGAAQLCGLASRLCDLDLSFNELGDGGVDALVRASSWKDLHRLDLTSCGIGFGGMATLMSAPSLSLLCTLDLSHNALTGEVDPHTLTKDRVALLEQTFATLNEGGADVAGRFYALLFERYPAVKPLFANVSMVAQRRHFKSALVTTIQSVGSPDALETMPTDLGRRHLDYGVALTHYYAVSSTLLDVMQEYVGDDWTRDVEEAWFEGLEAVANVMMRAHRTSAKTAITRDGIDLK